VRVAFLHSDKPREGLLADAFLEGARKHGHTTAAIALGDDSFAGKFDVVCMVGVKSRELFQAHVRAGSMIIYLDKGYCRHRSSVGRTWEYWRVAVNAHQPTRFLDRPFPGDRWKSLGIEIADWRSSGKQIVLAGSSAKYHEFYDLKDPTAWMRGVVRDLLDLTQRPLVYRPKPSWRDAVPITKTRFSSRDEAIGDALNNAWALVTHGSNACFEAVIAGIPCIVLGDAVAKPLSSTNLADVEAPHLASRKQRLRWAEALAYHQFTAAEFAAGLAWDVIKDEIHA